MIVPKLCYYLNWSQGRRVVCCRCHSDTVCGWVSHCFELFFRVRNVLYFFRVFTQCHHTIRLSCVDHTAELRINKVGEKCAHTHR